MNRRDQIRFHVGVMRRHARVIHATIARHSVRVWFDFLGILRAIF